MVDIDRNGIERTHRAMGGEGAILLLLKTERPSTVDALDSALPPDPDSPANGGWFAAPNGWHLLIEGLADQVDPWLTALADRLNTAGVDGTLTGAPRARTPRWAQATHDAHALTANIGFRVQPGHSPYGGWGGVEGSREAAVDAATAWLTGNDGKIMVHGEMDFQAWAHAEQARQALTSTDVQAGLKRIESYTKGRGEVRSALLWKNGRLELSTKVADFSWRRRVDELRAALRALSVGPVSVASISHRNWRLYFNTTVPGSDYYHRHAYQWHPELWGDYLIDASSIQVVTDQHLAKAADLSRWNITQLDDTHHLLEAPDLEPWYDEPARVGEQALPEVIHEARRDFGDMILTRQRAEQLGITTKPPRPAEL